MFEARKLTFTSGISLRRAEEMLSIYDMKELMKRLNTEEYLIEDLIKIIELASLGNLDAQNTLLRIKKIKDETINNSNFDITLFLLERLIDLRNSKKGTKLEEHINRLLADSVYDFLNCSRSKLCKYELLFKLVENCQNEILKKMQVAQKNGQKVQIMKNSEMLDMLFMNKNILSDKNWLECFKIELHQGNFILLKKILSLKHHDKSLNTTIKQCYKIYKETALLISYAIKEAELPILDTEIEYAVNLIIELSYKTHMAYSSILLDQYATILFDRKIFMEWKEQINIFQSKLCKETNKKNKLKLLDEFLLTFGVIDPKKCSELKKILMEINDSVVDNLTVWKIIKSSIGKFNHDVKTGEWKLISDSDKIISIVEEYYKIKRVEINGKIYETPIGKLVNFRKNLVLFTKKNTTEIEQIYNELFSSKDLEDKISDITKSIKKFLEKQKALKMPNVYLKQKLQFQEIITIFIAHYNFNEEAYKQLLTTIFNELEDKVDDYFFPIDGKIASEKFLEFFANKIIEMEPIARKKIIKDNFAMIKSKLFLNNIRNYAELKRKPVPKDIILKQNNFIIKIIEEAGLENDLDLRFIYLKTLLESDLIQQNISITDYRTVGKIFIQKLKLSTESDFDNYIKILGCENITVYDSAIYKGFEKEIKKPENVELYQKLFKKFEKLYEELRNKSPVAIRLESYKRNLFIALGQIFRKQNPDNTNTNFKDAVFLYRDNPTRTLDIGKITINGKEIDINAQTILYFDVISKFMSEKFKGCQILPKTQGGDDGFIIDTNPKTYVKYAYKKANCRSSDLKIKEYKAAKYISELIADACIEINIKIAENDEYVLFYTQAMSTNCKDLSEISLESLDTIDKKLKFKNSLIFNVIASGIFGIFDNRADNMSVDLNSGEVKNIDFSECPSNSQCRNAIHLNFKGQSLKEAFLEFIVDSNNKEEGTLGNDGTIDMISELLGNDEKVIKKVILEKFAKIKKIILQDIEKLDKLKNEEPRDEEKIKYQEKLLKTAITRYNEVYLFFNRHYNVGIESIFKKSVETTTIAIKDLETKSSDKTRTEKEFERKFSESFTSLNIEKISKLFLMYGNPKYQIKESRKSIEITFTFQNGIEKTIIISNGNDIYSKKCHIVELINMAQRKVKSPDKQSLNNMKILDLSEDFRNDEEFLTKYEVLEEKIISGRRYIKLKAVNLQPEIVFDFTIPAKVQIIDFITLSRQQGLINVIDEINSQQKNVEIRYFVDECNSEQLQELIMRMNGNFRPNLDRVNFTRIENKEELGSDSVKIPKFSSIRSLSPLLSSRSN